METADAEGEKKKDVDLILALDGLDQSGYVNWARLIQGRVKGRQVSDGLDDPGPQVFSWMKQEGSDEADFGDVSLYGTHDTITNRVRKLVRRGADSISVCAFAPLKSLCAAVAARGRAAIWVVGVLSSITPEEWEEENPGQSFVATQRNCFRKAVKAGAQGIICAPSDLPLAVEVLAEADKLGQMDLIVQGTRSPGADKGQQARVMTPAEAKAMGATKLVIGSQVTKHTDQLGELARIYAQLGQTMPGGPLPKNRQRLSLPPPST